MTEPILDREMRITRLVNGSRERVWAAWTNPEQLIQWWGPDGFTNTFHEIDVKEGGIWRFTMHGPDGVDYPNVVVYKELIEHEKMVFDHGAFENDPNGFETTVTFEEQDGKTLVTLRALFATVAQRNETVERAGAIEGGKQTLARLEEFITKQVND